MNLINFKEKLEDLKIDNIEEAIEKFNKYYSFLIQENEKYNLTNIIDYEDVLEKHFYDSIMLKKYVELKDFNILDIGSGAGFPGICLAIISPNTKFYLCEPTTKRANFLIEVSKLLELNNVVVLNKRVEDLDKKFYGFFNVVTSRAVSNLNILSELSIPFVKIDGYFIPYKGSKYEEEIVSSKKALKTLNSILEKIETYQIEDATHSLLFIKKLSKTQSKYPRNYSLIKTNPL